MSDEKEKEGGVPWDLSEAIKLMGEAVASRDQELIATAMRRHAEALSNAYQVQGVPTLRTVLETVVRSENKKVAASIVAYGQQQDSRFEYILLELKAYFKQADTRYDHFSNELTSIAEGLGGLRVGQDHLQSEFQSVGESVDGLRSQFGELSSSVTQLDDQFTDIRSKVEQLASVQERLQQEHTHLQNEQGDIIIRFERVEEQIQNLIKRLEEERQIRAQDHEDIRKQTIADEITATERREIVEVTRWLRNNLDRIVLHDFPVHEAIVRINKKQIITQVSPALLTMFGYDEDELVGKPLSVLLPEMAADHHAQFVEEFGRGKNSNRVMSERNPVHAKHKSGNLFPVKVTIGHDPMGYTAIVRHLNP